MGSAIFWKVKVFALSISFFGCDKEKQQRIGRLFDPKYFRHQDEYVLITFMNLIFYVCRYNFQ